MIWEALDTSLILPGLEAESVRELMQKLGGRVIEEGYAKESYVDALIARESEFPTGLNVDGVGVAIPHTSVEHVNKMGVAIATLKKPVSFVEMGTEDDPVEVELVFMLAVVDPTAHISQLQRIVEMIQDTDFLQTLLKSTSPAEIISAIKDKEEAVEAAA